MTGFG